MSEAHAEVVADKSLVGHFAPLEDTRDGMKRRHLLIDMVVIAIAGTLCGADGCTQIEQFGREKDAWLRRFLELPYGIPSHDTFGRVFSLLQPEAFERCFRAWVASIRSVISVEIIAIDGKTLRRSHDRAKGLAALHVVSAWANANHMVLGQVATEANSNEITAIPALLELLTLKGCIVTIDAMAVRPRSPNRSSTKAATTCLHSRATKRRSPPRSRRRSSMPTPATTTKWKPTSPRPSSAVMAGCRPAATAP